MGAASASNSATLLTPNGNRNSSTASGAKFRNEGHPRPRCFNIHEVKPHPSLWETMTGLWKGKDKKSLINAAIYLETHE